MTKQRKNGLWNRTTQALGKLWAGVVSLPDNRRQVDQAVWRFPPF